MKPVFAGGAFVEVNDQRDITRGAVHLAAHGLMLSKP
jgi:hypothetical protein